MKKMAKEGSKMSVDVVIIFRVYVYRFYNMRSSDFEIRKRQPFMC